LGRELVFRSMDVVIGAIIALVGSLIGGFLSPVVLARLSDRREIAREERVDRRALRAARMAAAQDVTEAMLLIASTPRSTEGAAAMLRATLNLELLLGDDDEQITTMVADAANAARSGTSTATLGAATLYLASWARGARSADECVAGYEKSTDRSLSNVQPSG
jgi:phosphotransacetylase